MKTNTYRSHILAASLMCLSFGNVIGQPYDYYKWAYPDNAATSMNTSVLIDVAQNDTLIPNGNYYMNQWVGVVANPVVCDYPSKYGTLTSLKGGTLTLMSANKILYTPPVGYVGLDVFTYGIDDAAKAGIYQVDSASVSINVGQNSSSSCVDFSQYSFADFQDRNNLSLYPMGSTLFQTGDIKLIKTSGGISGAYGGDTLGLTGSISIDVSGSSASSKKLTFAHYPWGGKPGVVVDGDTVFDGLGTPPANYSGLGFTFEYNAPYYSITGGINTVHVFNVAKYIYSICLEEVQSTSSCMDFSAYSNKVSDFNNNSLYPAGSALMSLGNGLVIKKPYPYQSTPSFQSTNIHKIDSTLMYFGIIDINTANSSYSCKKLNLYTKFGNGSNNLFIINGDTIVKKAGTMPSNYAGNGFNVTASGNLSSGYSVEITGNFWYVRIGTLINAGILKNVCYEECQTTSCNADFTYTLNGNTGSFVNTSGSATAYWFVNGIRSNLNFIYTQDLTQVFHNSGTYNVCLAVKDNAGNFCDSICKQVTVVLDSIKRTVITVNNDGKDDYVYIPCGSMEIYNRNGILVRNVNGPLHWDGRDNSENILPMGDYIGKCKEDGSVINVTIIR